MSSDVEPISMPTLHISKTKQALAWIVATLVGLAAVYISLMVWMFVGVCTGVIGMCSSAPKWWDVTFMCLTLPVLLPGVLAGRSTYRWFVEREQHKL